MKVVQMPRSYEMTGRTRGMERTREAILDAAAELFTPAWYDDVTLTDVARLAGVSQQTVLNHFGSKLGLYRAGVTERVAPAIVAARTVAVAGDVGSVVAAVVDDYERTGDATYRLMVVAERTPELADIVAAGRAAHRAFIDSVLAPRLEDTDARDRERTAVLLATALDVTVWRRLRRDEGLGVDAVREHLQLLVEGVLAAAPLLPRRSTRVPG